MKRDESGEWGERGEKCWKVVKRDESGEWGESGERGG